MTIKIWNDFKRYGFIMLPYTFVRSIGAVKAAVLCQILAEYNHAQNNKLNAGKYFLTDFNRMAKYLGLNVDELIKIITELQEMQFLWFEYSDIKDIYLICVDEDNIVSFKEQTEQENMYDDWNAGLLRAQDPVNRLTEFTSSLQEMQKFISKFINKPFPLVILAYCNALIKNYEQDNRQFIDLPNLLQDLKDILTNPDFRFEDIGIWVYDRCKQD